MSQTISATQRCPRCGNENRGDSFQCSFCGKRLRVESIENISFFRRLDAEEWTNPAPFYMKLYWLFRDPPRAFWDINHKRSKAPGFKILLINALLYGFLGLAFMSHFQFGLIGPQGTQVSQFSLIFFSYNMSIFITFFIFGLVFQFIFFSILIWLFSKGANYAVGFSERMEARFGEDEKEEKERYKQAEISPFSIYKGGVLLQKQESHKKKMLLCAFAPFLLINTIKILIVLVALPNQTIDVGSDTNTINDTIVSFMTSPQAAPVWAVLDILDAITIAVWVPILMTIAIRELANSSTIRVLISSLTIGIIVAIFFYFMRPTLFGAFTS